MSENIETTENTKSKLSQLIAELKIIAFSVLADLLVTAKKIPIINKKLTSNNENGKKFFGFLELDNDNTNIVNLKKKKIALAASFLLLLLIIISSLFSFEKKEQTEEEALVTEKEFAYVDKKIPYIIIPMPKEEEEPLFSDDDEDEVLNAFPEVFKELKIIEKIQIKAEEKKAEKLPPEAIIEKKIAPQKLGTLNKPLSEKITEDLATSKIGKIINPPKIQEKQKTTTPVIQKTITVFEPQTPAYKGPPHPIRDREENVLMKTPSLANLPLPDNPEIPLAEIIEPMPSLLMNKGKYLIPKPSDSGVSPWQVYARKFEAKLDSYPVAVIIRGLGLDEIMTDAVIRIFPPEITLSFSPYSPKISEYIKLARIFGHEVLIDLPMEPPIFPISDMGPKSLLTMLPPADNLLRLESILAINGAYSGLLGASNTVFGSSPSHMRPILEKIKKSGLLYVDNTEGKGVLVNRDTKVPIKIADLTVENDFFALSIRARLKYLEELAEYRGQALAVFDAKQVVIFELLSWIESFHGLDAMGKKKVRPYVLAPISAVVTE